MKNIFSLAVISFFLILTSCFNQPEIVKINKLEIINSTDDFIELDVNSLIKNPNNFQIKASNITMLFSYDGKNIGKGTIDSTIVLSSKSNSDIATRSLLKLKELSEFFPVITKLDSFPINVHIEAKFTSMKIPIKRDFIKYINTQEMISALISGGGLTEKIRIKEVEIYAPNFSNTSLRMVFSFTNTIPVNYTVTKIVADIYDNSKMKSLLGSSISEHEIVLERDSTKNIPCLVELNNFNMAKTMLSKFIRMDRSFFLSGIIFVEVGGNSFEIPLKTKITAPLPIN